MFTILFDSTQPGAPYGLKRFSRSVAITDAPNGHHAISVTNINDSNFGDVVQVMKEAGYEEHWVVEDRDDLTYQFA